MKKIILIGPFPPPYNGQSVCFKMLIDGLFDRNIDFSVINISPKHEFPSRHEKAIRIFEYLKVVYQFLRFFKFQKCIVYITISQAKSGFFRDAAIIWLARISNSRIVTHVHGGYYDGLYNSMSFFLKKILIATLHQVDKIIILSENLKKMFSFDSTLNSLICVVPNGLPISKKDLMAQPKSISAGDTIKILYLSNLIESKGYLDVLRAVNILKNKFELNIICHFCGEFKTNEDDKTMQSIVRAKSFFSEFIQTNNLENNVKYVGNVDGAEKIKELREAHFFVLPSNFNKEGQPVSIIEAIAFGCVIISTEYRAIPSMVAEGYNGAFVTYGSPEQIAHAVRSISLNTEKFKKLSSNSIELYNRLFTKEKHLNDILSIITGEQE